ncbi:hypothetical protein GCM10009546_62480 [Actinomadura livida]|uniref:Septum formation-related domain-containing protein n=1 Tax=Actinomadura livida TaxID=79909 RepID=A0ABN1FIQ9_9ACTN|nr:hypothetical protein GCM10010208_16070 [Actinomadura livida]
MQPPPHPYGQPPPAAPARTNKWAIASLVTGVLGLVVLGVIFGIVALLQAGGRGEKGKGLAIGGLLASAFWTVAGVVALLVAAGSLISVDRDESGQVTEKDRVVVAALRTGDCFTGFEGDTTKILVTALPCSRPHDGEVVAKLRLSGKAHPGDEKVSEQADNACFEKSLQLQKSRHSKDLEPYNLWPSRTSWDAGDREVVCLMRYTGSGTLTSPLRETIDASRKLWDELTAGDCLGKWDDESYTQRTVSCTDPYWIQVYATFPLKAGPYPGQKAMDRTAQRGCERRQEKVFRGHRLPDLMWWLYPEEVEWDAGHRTAVCFAESEGRPLKKPMLPR